MRGYQSGFGNTLSKSGKKFLIIYGIIYIVQLLLEHWVNIPVTNYLALHPLDSSGFKFYQFVTHFFIHNPGSPFGFLINALVFYFFASQVESRYGTSSFFSLFYIAAIVGGLAGFVFALAAPAPFTQPFYGMTPSLLAIIVLFGFLNPNATILLFFVLPVRAVYLSYGTIIITVLTLLAKANPAGAYHLGGIFIGYLFLKYPLDIFNYKKLHLSYLQWQHKKRKSKFDVIDGGYDDDDDDKGPTIH